MLTVLGFLLPVDFTRKFFFAVRQDVDLGGIDTTSVHARDFQLSADVQTGHRVLEELSGHTGIDQGAKEHVPADTGKAIEVGNPHVSTSSLVVGRWQGRICNAWCVVTSFHLMLLRAKAII